jgi:hypothetical protein
MIFVLSILRFDRQLVRIVVVGCIIKTLIYKLVGIRYAESHMKSNQII